MSFVCLDVEDALPWSLGSGEQRIPRVTPIPLNRPFLAKPTYSLSACANLRMLLTFLSRSFMLCMYYSYEDAGFNRMRVSAETLAHSPGLRNTLSTRKSVGKKISVGETQAVYCVTTA